MKEVRNIQVLRGIAAVGVILYHLVYWEGKFIGPHGVVPFQFHVGEMGVDLFFVISGFIMAYIQPLPLNNLRLYARFMVHRFTRIYPPVWLVMLLLLPVYLKHPELFNNFYHHKEELLRSFLLAPQDYTPLLGVAWTLIHEVYFYVVVSVALIFLPTGRLVFGLAWFVIISTVFWATGQGDFGGNRWLQLIFSPFSMTFLLGYFIGLWYTRGTRDHVYPALGCIALAVAGVILSYRILPETGIYPNNNSLLRFLCYGIPSGFLVLGAVLLEAHMRRRFVTLRHLGNESYSIYLLHLPILTLIYKGIAACHSTNPLLLLSAAIFSLVSCIGAGALFHRYMELRLTRGARRIAETWLGLIDLRHPETI